MHPKKGKPMNVSTNANINREAPPHLQALQEDALEINLSDSLQRRISDSPRQSDTVASIKKSVK